MSWWPGWNSIEGAAKWGDIFFWAGFAFLVLLVGCEALSKVYGWRKDTLIVVRDNLIAVAADIRIKQADQERVEAQARHDAEIAAARSAEIETEKTEPEPQPQPQSQPAARDADPLARTSEQVARLHAYRAARTADWQAEGLLGYALMVNGLALHRHRRRHPTALAA